MSVRINVYHLAQGVSLQVAAENLVLHFPQKAVDEAVSTLSGKLGFSGELNDFAANIFVRLVQQHAEKLPSDVELNSCASSGTKEGRTTKKKKGDREPLLDGRVTSVEQLAVKAPKKSIFCCFCCNVVE